MSKGLLVAVATDVKCADLREGRTLENFRCDPAGKSLLERFQIPLSWGKLTVDEAYLKAMDESTEAASNRKIALQTLADLESTQLWQPQRRVRMERLEALNILGKFLKNSSKAALTHWDPYFDFLDIAAACFSLVQEGGEDGKKLLPALLDAVTWRKGKAGVIYRGEFADNYARVWERLGAFLEKRYRGEDVDVSTHLHKVFEHPFQSKGAKADLAELYPRMASAEFLARKCAYWNKYFLENKRYLDESGNIHDERYRTLREGTLFTLLGELYEVKKVVMEGGGFVMQICMPVHTDRYTREGSSIPLKLVFQGTIGHKASFGRDKNITWPGGPLWKEKGYNLIRNALEEVLKIHPKAHFAIETAGHSLGGADAQEAAKKIISMDHLRPHIALLDVTTYNAAGITDETAKQFSLVVNSEPRLLGRVIHSLVDGDVVQSSGCTHLGDGVEDAHKVQLIQILNDCRSKSTVHDAEAKHCDLVYARGPRIYATRMVDPRVDRAIVDFYQKRLGRDFLNHADKTLRRGAKTNALLRAGQLVLYRLARSRIEDPEGRERLDQEISKFNTEQFAPEIVRDFIRGGRRVLEPDANDRHSL
ncbi:MAG: hypothetical protein K940chlam7_01901 [Chlamydiae bacterium]|nr:hypothetical protein [Chlamydiota bacterium]